MGCQVGSATMPAAAAMDPPVSTAPIATPVSIMLMFFPVSFIYDNLHLIIPV